MRAPTKQWGIASRCIYRKVRTRRNPSIAGVCLHLEWTPHIKVTNGLLSELKCYTGLPYSVINFLFTYSSAVDELLDDIFQKERTVQYCIMILRKKKFHQNQTITKPKQAKSFSVFWVWCLWGNWSVLCKYNCKIDNVEKVSPHCGSCAKSYQGMNLFGIT